MNRILPDLVLVTVFAIGTILACFFLEVSREDLNSTVFALTTLALFAARATYDTYFKVTPNYPSAISPYWTTDPGLMATFLTDVLLDIIWFGAIGISAGMTILAASANGIID